MNTTWVSLSLLVWLPIVAGAAVLALRRVAEGKIAYQLALVSALVVLFGAVSLFFAFDSSIASAQFIERAMWIEHFQIEYALGIDGLSMLLILVNAVITLAALLLCDGAKRNAQAGALLITSGLTYGALMALDGALFYIFFEAMLIPTFFLVGVFGGEHRKAATIKFFLYTLFGSLFMLLALFILYGEAGNFSIELWREMSFLEEQTQWLVFLFFMIAFAVKTPMFPLHGWSPDTYAEGPTPAIVLLASTKIGAYAMLRLLLPIAPDVAHVFAPFIIGLSLFALVYFSIVALAQTDFKRLIAYSSMAHMAMVTLGFFLFNEAALKGAVLLLVANALVAGALFFAARIYEKRAGSSLITACRGLAKTMPFFATAFVVFAMANVALPGTTGFVGEFLVILGAIKSQLWIGIVAATVLILGAAYTLSLVKRVVFGEVTQTGEGVTFTLAASEICGLLLFAVLIVFFGVYPQPLLATIDTTVTDLLKHILHVKGWGG